MIKGILKIFTTVFIKKQNKKTFIVMVSVFIRYILEIPPVATEPKKHTILSPMIP